jgi:enoyl-CoA hydratase
VTEIELEKDSDRSIATITFNRPKKLNAFTLAMYRSLADAIDDVEQDDSIKVVILRGEGSSFSTGQDLGEVGFMYGFEEPKAGERSRRPSQRRRLAVDKDWARNLSRVAYCSKVTIAEVHGYCLGSGFDIFLACDLSVVAEDAVLGHPGRRLVGPGLGFNTVTWMWKLGPGLAKYLSFTGATITGAEARQHGVTWNCVGATETKAKAQALAETVAHMPADGLVMGKASLNLASDISGVGLGYDYGFIMHTLGTNVRFDEDEFNFFRERRDQGVSAAYHERDRRFEHEPESR